MGKYEVTFRTASSIPLPPAVIENRVNRAMAACDRCLEAVVDLNHLIGGYTLCLVIEAINKNSALVLAVGLNLFLGEVLEVNVGDWVSEQAS